MGIVPERTDDFDAPIDALHREIAASQPTCAVDNG
jgi:hypothetical protein